MLVAMVGLMRWLVGPTGNILGGKGGVGKSMVSSLQTMDTQQWCYSLELVCNECCRFYVFVVYILNVGFWLRIPFLFSQLVFPFFLHLSPYFVFLFFAVFDCTTVL